MSLQRSILVTVIAWLFIVFSSLGLINAVLFMAVPLNQLMPAFHYSSGVRQPDPAVTRSLMQRVMLLSALIDAWVLLSAIGLLRRQSWARISIIVIAAIGTGISAIYALLGGIGALVLRHYPEAIPAFPDIPWSAVTLLTLVGACGFLLLAFNLWVLVKLLSKAVGEEFEPTA